MTDYIQRFLDRDLDDLLSELPAVMLVGPRAAGKSTTAARRARTVISLDEPNVAAAFSAAPDVALAAQGTPVLLDEWQEVPDVLGAVKRAVDSRQGAGRFLLTGSVRARVSGATWPGTGRVIQVPMWGLAVAEKVGSLAARRFLSDLFDGVVPARARQPAPALGDYLAEILAGGFPPTVGLGERARSAWLAGYVEELVERDVPALARVRSPRRLGLALRAVALSTAGSPSEATLAEAVGVDARTLGSYLDLLEDLKIIERVPAWYSNRLTRLVKAPKYYLTDSGLAASVIGVGAAAIMRSGDILGRLLDTFVAAQLRPLLSLDQQFLTMHHVRDRGGTHEVDIVVESRRGDVVGIEVKASGRVDQRDARHLVWLRDHLGDQFRFGVVFHTGPLAYPIGERIVALPVAAIWGAGDMPSPE